MLLIHEGKKYHSGSDQPKYMVQSISKMHEMQGFNLRVLPEIPLGLSYFDTYKKEDIYFFSFLKLNLFTVASKMLYSERWY